MGKDQILRLKENKKSNKSKASDLHQKVHRSLNVFNTFLTDPHAYGQRKMTGRSKDLAKYQDKR